ncbi:hypothetical protein ACFYUD_33025 [Nocardia tengchongensis]|uniref:hypothetical protein n=1 Tax=Nocardia tengchongensis TaxID=2055889 RepID=UPI0036BEDF74
MISFEAREQRRYIAMPAVPDDAHSSATTVETDCPTRIAHKRLDEAHRWWHGCQEHYDNPRAFQQHLNACLQSLRNVTFALQKEKRGIDNFDEWYPAWQDKMRGDPVMRWLVNSRNRVVKQDDLEIESTATIRALLDYSDVVDLIDESLAQAAREDGAVTRRISPLTDPPEYLRYLRSLPRQVIRDGSFVVERRWVDKALPDIEILEALAHCYSVLSGLLKDAHRAAGVLSDAAEKLWPSDYLRPPCMVTTLDRRSTQYRIDDGSPVSSVLQPMRSLSKRELKRADKKYGLEEFSAALASCGGYTLDAVDPLFDLAKKVLEADRYHQFITILVDGTGRTAIEAPIFEDRISKHRYFKDLALRVASRSIDAVITISELWESSLHTDSDGSVVPPGEAPDRRELLEVFAVTADGSSRHRGVYFHRRFRKIVFDEEFGPRSAHETSVQNNSIEPVLAVWRRRAELDR